MGVQCRWIVERKQWAWDFESDAAPPFRFATQGRWGGILRALQGRGMQWGRWSADPFWRKGVGAGNAGFRSLSRWERAVRSGMRSRPLLRAQGEGWVVAVRPRRRIGSADPSSTPARGRMLAHPCAGSPVSQREKEGGQARLRRLSSLAP